MTSGFASPKSETIDKEFPLFTAGRHLFPNPGSRIKLDVRIN